MADRIYKIQLTGESAGATAAAKQTAEALKGVGESAKVTTTHLKTAKDGLKGLAMEFPVAANLMRLAMNPVAAAVAGIVGGITLWKARMEAMSAAMTGLQFNDWIVDPGKISAATEAWKAYSDAVQAVAEKYNSVESSSARRVKDMEKEVAMQKKILEGEKAVELARANADVGEIETRYGRAGLAMDAGAKGAALAEQKRLAEEMRIEEEAMLAAGAGLKVPTAAEQQEREKKFRADATTAREDNVKANARLDRLNELDGPPSLSSGVTLAKLNYDYGEVFRNSPENRDRLRNRERARIADNQTNIDAEREFFAGKPETDRLIALKAKLPADAGELAAKRQVLLAGIASQEASAPRDSANSRLIGNLDALAKVSTERNKKEKELEQFTKEMARFIESVGAIPEKLTQKVQAITAEIDAANVRIKNLEGAVSGQRQTR